MKEIGRAVFFQKLERVFGIEPLPRLAEAYQLAKAIHRPQIRKTGERYIAHPKAVALILLKYGPTNPQEIITALLHDCLEDGYILPSMLEKLFGYDLAFRVKLLTKYEIQLFSAGNIMKAKKSDQLYEDMLWAAPKDARRVKCADRIHNLSTMMTLPPEHRRKQIAETRRFYLEFAQKTDPRLGSLMERICCRVERSLKDA